MVHVTDLHLSKFYAPDRTIQLGQLGKSKIWEMYNCVWWEKSIEGFLILIDLFSVGLLCIIYQYITNIHIERTQGHINNHIENTK